MESSIERAILMYKANLEGERDRVTVQLQRGGSPSGLVDDLAKILQRIAAVDYVLAR